MTYLFPPHVERFSSPEDYSGEFHTTELKEIQALTSRMDFRRYASHSGVSLEFLRHVKQLDYSPDKVLHLYKTTLKISLPTNLTTTEISKLLKIRPFRITNSRRFRKYNASHSSSVFQTDIKEVQKSVPAGPWALQAIARSDGSTLTLNLLAQVQHEQQGTTNPDSALRQRLQSLPLSVLEDCKEHFQSAGDHWYQQVVRPLALQVGELQAKVERARLNMFLYHIAWWQRTYPFEVLTAVLELHRSQPLLFPPIGPELPPFMKDRLEGVSMELHPELAGLPWRLRCDILMSFPHTQITVAKAYLATHPSEKRDSYTQEDPLVELQDYLPREEIVPLTECGLSCEQYRRIRLALEHHKKDGVRRLCDTPVGKE